MTLLFTSTRQLRLALRHLPLVSADKQVDTWTIGSPSGLDRSFLQKSEHPSVAINLARCQAYSSARQVNASGEWPAPNESRSSCHWERDPFWQCVRYKHPLACQTPFQVGSSSYCDNSSLKSMASCVYAHLMQGLVSFWWIVCNPCYLVLICLSTNAKAHRKECCFPLLRTK